MSDKFEIILGSDHDGFFLKETVKSEFNKLGFDVNDIGTFSADKPADYPDFAAKVASAVSQKTFSRGVLVSGTGMGASITANRYPGVRAVVCTNVTMAVKARSELECNILVLAAEYTPRKKIARILKAWQNTEFLNGHHSTLIHLIDDNTRLNLAMGHLENLDYSKVSGDRINFPFWKRTFKGLEKLKKEFFPEERRSIEINRQSESCTATFTHENSQFHAIMVDVSEQGAQFAISADKESPPYIRGEEIEFSVKTSYGKTAFNALVRWYDPVSNHLGVTFSKALDDPKDPLNLLIDSML